MQTWTVGRSEVGCAGVEARKLEERTFLEEDRSEALQRIRAGGTHTDLEGKTLLYGTMEAASSHHRVCKLRTRESGGFLPPQPEV